MFWSALFARTCSMLAPSPVLLPEEAPPSPGVPVVPVGVSTFALRSVGPPRNEAARTGPPGSCRTAASAPPTTALAPALITLWNGRLGTAVVRYAVGSALIGVMGPPDSIRVVMALASLPSPIGQRRMAVA